MAQEQDKKVTDDANTLEPSAESKVLPIFESDLDTDESETDEDFYDEYPQRLANKLLTEKRNQLILLSSLASSNDGSNIATPDLSRTSTPSFPPDETPVTKKLKSKKRKKDKKNRVFDSLPTMINPSTVLPISLKINIPKKPEFVNGSVEPVKIITRPLTPKIDLMTTPPVTQMVSSLVANPPQVTNPQNMSVDDNKRASKRRRIPNKFYGYSSDEETGMLKPQPPPQLTWHKEDLPEQPPKIVEPPRVPPLPIHQILAQQQITLTKPTSDLSDNAKSSPSDESSSDEGTLHISQPSAASAHISGPTISSAATKQSKEGESVYCYCRCPYDEVSEMIACDGLSCSIEWFHFECVGIMVPPKGKWYCPECRQKQHPQPPKPDFLG